MFDKLCDLPIDTVQSSTDEESIVNIMFAPRSFSLSSTVKTIVSSLAVFVIVSFIFSLSDDCVSTTIPSDFLTVFKAFVCSVLFYIVSLILSCF